MDTHPDAEADTWFIGHIVVERILPPVTEHTQWNLKEVRLFWRGAEQQTRRFILREEGTGRWKSDAWTTITTDDIEPTNVILIDDGGNYLGLRSFHNREVKVAGDHFQQAETDPGPEFSISWLTLVYVRSLPMPSLDDYTLCELVAEITQGLFGPEKTDMRDSLVETSRMLASATDVDHPRRAKRMFNLGEALMKRFRLNRELGDLNEAIHCYQTAATSARPGSVERLDWLYNFGMALMERFALHMDIQVDDEMMAYLAFEKALQPTLIDEDAWMRQALLTVRICLGPLKPFLPPDSTSFMMKVLQRVAERFDDYPEGIIRVSLYMSEAHIIRFKQSGDRRDMDGAVSAVRNALEVADLNGHCPLHPCYFLGKLLIDRFKLGEPGNFEDLEQGISALRRALGLCDESSEFFISTLRHLASGLTSRSQSGDLGESISLLRRAATCYLGDPQVKAYAASEWTSLLFSLNPRSPELLSAIDIGVHWIRSAGGYHRTASAQYEAIQVSRLNSTFIRNGAAIACQLEFPERAVEWLEQGYSRVWTQLRSLRAPVDELLKHDRHLAEDFMNTSKRLQDFATSPRRMEQRDLNAGDHYFTNAALNLLSHSQAAREWEILLKRARDIPGFEDFLKPITCSKLLQQLPASGPVVVINLDDLRCDAIALLSGMDEPFLIPLPEFSLKTAEKYRKDLHDSLMRHGLCARQPEPDLGHDDSSRPMGTYRRRGDAGVAVNRILRGLWKLVVKPILDALGFPRSDLLSTKVLPRIWWCPTGPLSFLPLHAAGIYEDPGRESLLDYAVSSYTPTVTSLADRLMQTAPINDAVAGLLLTCHPDAIPSQPIPGAAREVDSVYESALKNGVRAVKRDGSTISVDECLQAMGRFSSVHLACHASQDSTSSRVTPSSETMGTLPPSPGVRRNIAKPLASRFHLHHGSLDLQAIIERNLEYADFAFLSACQTSMGDDALSDENAHLAAGMLAAGYRRVVATMWSINDGVAEQVANDFYQYLWDQRPPGTVGGFDGSHSAYALHSAVQKLRLRLDDSDSSLLKWVPYVHWGY